MGMRRETLKALEQVRDHVVTERKQSKMQTLGASNPHNNNRDKHRNAPKVTQVTVLQYYFQPSLIFVGKILGYHNLRLMAEHSSLFCQSINFVQKKNKLKCLFMASIFTLIKYLWVRLSPLTLFYVLNYAQNNYQK